MLVFSELFFAAGNGFSGQIFFAEWLPTMYNAVWTSWQCLFAYSIEQVSIKTASFFRMSMTSIFTSFPHFIVQVRKVRTLVLRYFGNGFFWHFGMELAFILAQFM